MIIVSGGGDAFFPNRLCDLLTVVKQSCMLAINDWSLLQEQVPVTAKKLPGKQGMDHDQAERHRAQKPAAMWWGRPFHDGGMVPGSGQSAKVKRFSTPFEGAA